MLAYSVNCPALGTLPAGYGCHHPLRDVVAPPFEDEKTLITPFYKNTRKLSVDDLVATKRR